MSEFSWSGGQLPHDHASSEEHLREVAEDVQHEKAADKAMQAPRSKDRPWWRFWGKRSG